MAHDLAVVEPERVRRLVLAALHCHNSGADDFRRKRGSVEREPEQKRGEFGREQTAAGKAKTAENRIFQRKRRSHDDNRKRETAITEKYTWRGAQRIGRRRKALGNDRVPKK